MNHPSEWAKFFDERAGCYRYKHKGSGLVRDTLMAIGKTLKKGATNVAKKVVRSSAEKAGKKLSEVVVEKGSDKIQRILQKRRPKTPTPKPSSSQRTCPESLVASRCNDKTVSNFGEPALKIFPMNIRNDVQSPPRYLEKTEYIQFNLNTPLNFPGNGQHQVKNPAMRFFVRDRNNVYDWYNAYFRVNFNFQALADGAMLLVTHGRPPSTVLFP